MAVDFDRETFLKPLTTATAELNQAVALGKKLAKQGIQRIYFVGCGAPNRNMFVVHYWAQRAATKLDVRLYYPAEFVDTEPVALDNKTLVFLSSHSGTTKEIITAAEYLKDKPCITVGVTQKADSPLGKLTQQHLLYGECKSGYYASFMLVLAMVSAILNELEPAWTVHDKLVKSLKVFPSVIADTIEQSEAQATEYARIYKDSRITYLVGSGPCFSTAYVLGVCVLMEMQWIHAYPIVAAELFHGPFEAIDQDSHVILFVGEDPTRQEAERAVRFCKKYTERLMIYDSKDYAMKGVDPSVRGIFSPFVLEAAASRFPEHLAVWHNHPLTTRRYMWKTEY